MSSTSSTSNSQLITDALATYEKITGIDLSNHPFDAALKQAKSPGAILELLQKRENELKDYREGYRRLINFISPVVTVIQTFSDVLGASVSLASHFPPAKASRALFVGINVLLSVRPLIRLTGSLVTYEFSRPPVRLRQVTIPSWTSLSAWGISSSVWRHTRQSSLRRCWRILSPK